MTLWSICLYLLQAHTTDFECIIFRVIIALWMWFVSTELLRHFWDLFFHFADMAGQI